jgi:transcriptional regulator GlxA family with amidase domain
MAETQIVFLILPHLHLLDLAGPDQVFLEAKDYGTAIRLRYCSFTQAVHTSTGLPFGALENFSNITFNAGDYLFVPGADMKYLLSDALKQEKELINWFKAAYTEGVFIGSICTGAFFLAMTGLLDGRKCTTHWKHATRLKTLYPKTLVQENILFVEDERVLTSAGVTAGIDLALFILSRLRDDLTSFKVARELVVYNRRIGSEAQMSIYMQYRNHIHSGIHAVQEWLLEHLSQKPNLMTLAEIACMSPRNLTRIFKKETGITINDYITLLRKEKLNILLKNPDMTRAQIANACGLKSERQLSRLLKYEV